MKYDDKIHFHHVMVVSRSLDSANCVMWSLMDNPGRHDTNHVTGLISKSIDSLRPCRKDVSASRLIAKSAIMLWNGIHASYGSFPKGYKLPVPWQFQPIYYSCCFDVRPAAGCCDTGSQSKTLVGTTGRLAVDATSRNLYSQPKARMDGRKIQEETIYRKERVGWVGGRTERTGWLLVGSFVCWRFIQLL